MVWCQRLVRMSRCARSGTDGIAALRRSQGTRPRPRRSLILARFGPWRSASDKDGYPDCLAHPTRGHEKSALSQLPGAHHHVLLRTVSLEPESRYSDQNHDASGAAGTDCRGGPGKRKNGSHAEAQTGSPMRAETPIQALSRHVPPQDPTTVHHPRLSVWLPREMGPPGGSGYGEPQQSSKSCRH